MSKKWNRMFHRLVQVAVSPHEKGDVQGIQDAPRQESGQYVARPAVLLPIGHQEDAPAPGSAGTQAHGDPPELRSEIPLPLRPEGKGFRFRPPDAHCVQCVKMLHQEGLVHDWIVLELPLPAIEPGMRRHIVQMLFQLLFLPFFQSFPVCKGAAVFIIKVIEQHFQSVSHSPLTLPSDG